MLKVGIKLNDSLATLSVQTLDTQIETIITMEDKQLFAVVMEQIGEKCVQSVTATTTEVGDCNIQYVVNPTSASTALSRHVCP
jgi:carbamoylphosphate synthase large subunit